jgi:GNAT superfamily N-acetyltransferase
MPPIPADLHVVSEPPLPAIRFLRSDDIEAIVALESAQLEEHGIPHDTARIRMVVRELVISTHGGFILLAEVGREAIGFAYAACLLSLEHGAPSGWLEELYVVPAWRNQGVGGALLGRAITHARELRWPALELEVVHGHDRAAALYRRAGFSPMNRTRYSLDLSIPRS